MCRCALHRPHQFGVFTIRFVNRVVSPRQIANRHAAVAILRHPELNVQIIFGEIVFLRIDPGLMFGLHALRWPHPLPEHRPISHHAPDAVATNLPAVKVLAIEQRFPPEVRGKRDFARRGPFRTPRQQCLKVHIVQVGIRLIFPGMPQHGGVDPALAVSLHPVHRLPLSGYFRECIRQHRNTLGRTMLAMRQLLCRVSPVRGQASCNRMLLIQHEHLKFMAGTMSRRQARALRDRHSFLVHYRNAGAKGFVAPPQAKHLVVLRPLQESVVGRMENHQTSALPYKLLQRNLHLTWPAFAVSQVPAIEVIDHDVVAREIRLQRRPGCHVHCKATRAFQRGANRRRARRPVVVIHSVDNQGG